MTVVRTLGHGAGSLEDFLALVEGAGVERVVDVRTAPGSRKHPHFGKDALAAELARHGVAYHWRGDLGGWRKPRPDSRHTALRNQGFRGYADHMESDDFRVALEWLIETSGARSTAVMCAESLWWRCHRSMIADALTAAGHRAIHLLPDGREEPHRLHRAARLEGGTVVYDRN